VGLFFLSRQAVDGNDLTAHIEDNGNCFIMRDANGQALSYVYYENDPGRRMAADLLTRDEARLPELLGALKLRNSSVVDDVT
jgi:hypothetical protein